MVLLCKSPVIHGDSMNLWSLHKFMEMTLPDYHTKYYEKVMHGFPLLHAFKVILWVT